MIIVAFCSQYAFWTSLIGREVRFFEMASASMACLATYTFDRLASKGDDASSKYRLRNSGRPAKVMLGMQCLAFLGLGARAHHVVRNALFALPFGILYTRTSVPKRLFLASKNMYVTAMWASWFFGACEAIPVRNLTEARVVGVYVLHMFMSNVIMDVKDIDQDRKEGVPTIPARIGYTQSRAFLLLYTAALAALAVCLSVDLSISYLLFGTLLRVTDVRSGDYASLCTVSLMMLPMVVSECRQGRPFVPLLCAAVTSAAAATRSRS